jgi:hypothetical protein
MASYISITREEERCTEQNNHDFRKGPIYLDGHRDLVCLQCHGVIRVHSGGKTMYVPHYRADEHWSQELEDELHTIDAT